MSRACLVCGAPLQRPATGRPPDYCGEPCRRAAEYERRRLDRQIDDLERWARNLRLMAQTGPQLERVDAELAAMRRRFLALLGDGNAAPVSPQ